jgi:hypothetical protein
MHPTLKSPWNFPELDGVQVASEKLAKLRFEQ